MAHALRDFISVGVPHRVIKSDVTADLLEEFGLEHGRTCQLNASAADRLRMLLKHAGSAEAGPGAKLAVQLSIRGSRVGILDLGQQQQVLKLFQFGEASTERPVDLYQKLPRTASACRFILSAPGKPVASAIHYGSISGLVTSQSSLMVRSTKILCVEDRLWDVDGGAGFAEKVSRIAHAAGRRTMLLFSDADCSFRNRVAIKAFASANVDLLAGESEAVLMAYGLQRLDSLVPQIRRQGKKAILRRTAHEPLVLDGSVREWATLPVHTHGAYFWNSFLPTLIEEFAMTGRLDSMADQGDESKDGLQC